MRKLVLRLDRLTVLTPAELDVVDGAGPSGPTCLDDCSLGNPPTYGLCDTKVPTRCLCP